MKIVRGFYGLTIQILVVVLIVCAFVFAGGCFEDIFGKTNDTGKTVTTDKEGANYTEPYCTRPLCCGVITCPNMTNNNCLGGCGLVCVETELLQKVKPSSSTNCTTSQILKTGEEAIISIQGQKLAVTVDSFKEYKPSNIEKDSSCLRLKWYVLQIKYTNVGDEEIRNPMAKRYSRYAFPFTLVDSKGNELTYPNANAHCPEWPVETYDPNPPDEILFPGGTGYYTGKYIFTDNNTVEPEWFKYLPNIRDIQNGAAVHYKQIRCLDDRYDSNNCPNNKITEDDIAWTVYP
jgi:hypothetical protein